MHLLTGYVKYFPVQPSHHYFHAYFIENFRKDRCQFSMNVKVHEPTLNEVITNVGLEGFFPTGSHQPVRPYIRQRASTLSTDVRQWGRDVRCYNNVK